MKSMSETGSIVLIRTEINRYQTEFGRKPGAILLGIKAGDLGAPTLDGIRVIGVPGVNVVGVRHACCHEEFGGC